MAGLYSEGFSDAAGSIISITRNGQTKMVYHQGDCGPIDSAPPELCILEEKIDLITNSAQWTGH